MKNIHDALPLLEKHKMFVFVKKKNLLNKTNSQLIGWRNDGIGSRLCTYVNIVRLSKKLKKNFTFYWDLRDDESSPSYPQNITTKIDYYLPNLKNIKFYNSKNEKITKNSIIEWKIIILDGEDKKKVLKEWCKIVNSLFVNCNIEKKNIFKKYNYGLHVRLGDLDAFTSKKYSKKNYFSYRENFSLGKWYPEIFWQDIAKKINKKILISSSDYKIAKKIFKKISYISYMNSFISRKNDETYSFLFDIISIAQAKNIVCSMSSGTGLILSFLTPNNVFTPEKFLKNENIFFEFYQIYYTIFLKHNTVNSLLQHNLQYFFSRILILKNSINEYFKWVKK
tara:strand:- start:80 stop:1090 length:1011 start_codon:yes stop_codon:yes gene_type:complete